MQVFKKWVAGLLFGIMGLYVALGALDLLIPGGGGEPEEMIKYEREARLQRSLDEIDRIACQQGHARSC